MTTKRVVLGLTGFALFGFAFIATPIRAASDRELDTPLDPTNVWVREPVLIYDMTGYGFAGLMHRHVAVYNDGVVNLSKTGIIGTDVRALQIDSAQVEALRRQLIAAGAATLRDDPSGGADIPLTTVTFFAAAAPRTWANTFSYYFPAPAWMPVEQAIGNFIAAVAPGF
ncbi:MAG: hypothetical protein U1D55_12100 [Phycisphaerae bacterium]